MYYNHTKSFLKFNMVVVFIFIIRKFMKMKLAHI